MQTSLENQKCAISSLAITSLLLSLAAQAGEPEEQLIQQVTDAYGGDALRNLTFYTISRKSLVLGNGQSRIPRIDEPTITNLHFAVDIANGKARLENLFSGRGDIFQDTTINDGDQGWNINYSSKTYGAAQNPDVYAFAGSTMRTNDALLAYELNKVKDKAKIIGDTDYLNRPHVMLEMSFPPLSPTLTLYIDKESHFISKMTRMNPQAGLLDYIFSDVTATGAINYATKVSFFVAGDTNLM